MKLTLSAMTVVLVTTLLPFAPASGFPGDNGRLTYSVDNEGIFTSDPDGSDVVELSDSGSDIDPAWSADGSKIAYRCGKDVCTMKADGSDKTRVTSDISVSTGQPAWSPDGNRIAHQRFHSGELGGNVTLWIMDEDGSNAEELTDFRSSNPAFSPDGNRIVFTRGKVGVEGIWSIRPDGTGLKVLFNETQYISRPTWSPDGRTIAFLLQDRNKWRLWTMNRDGGDVRQIYKPSPRQINGRGLAWSPDGRYFLLRDLNGSLFRLNRDGTGMRSLHLLGMHQDWAPVLP